MADDGKVVSIVDEIGKAIDEAAPVASTAEDPAPGDRGGDRAEVPATEQDLPAGCPVTPLGIAGDWYHFLDADRQLRSFKHRDMARTAILSLFGIHSEQLYAHWPRMKKDADGEWIVTGWKPEIAAERLMRACHRLGIWDVAERVRGAGAWLGEGGELVMHCGSKLVFAAPDPSVSPRIAERPTGEWDGYVYPSDALKPLPAKDHAAPNPAIELLSLLKTWRWKRGDTDAVLLLGWIAAAMMGGALSWRPMIWVTGDKSTGKSTLIKIIKALFGTGLLSASDASAASLWQKLGHASLPIALDEQEAENDQRKLQMVVRLARQAASGDVILRGGADHQSVSFTARSCFMFQAVVIPALQSQDISRMAILELEPLPPPGDPAATELPALVPKRFAAMGAAMRRRLLQGWPRWAATFEAYTGALTRAGHGARGADQFGTLLAAADLLLSDHPPHVDELSGWGSKLSAAQLAAETDDQSDHDQCLARLLSSPDPYRSTTPVRTIGEMVAGVVGKLPGITDGRFMAEGLERCGVKVVRDHDLAGPRTEQNEYRWIAVANSHQGLASIYADSHWKALSGTSGGWVRPLRRVTAMDRDGNLLKAQAYGVLRFAGVASRCSLLPLEAVLTPDLENRR